MNARPKMKTPTRIEYLFEHVMPPRFRVLSNKNTLLPKLYLGFAVFSTVVFSYQGAV